jgi:translation elongation factor P/translation initiation factor 5A
MATYYSNDFRAGLKICWTANLMRLKPANSLNQVKARRLRVKLRRLLTGTRVEKPSLQV